LAAQGLVIKKQGKGTFVAEKSADPMVGPLISSSEVFLLNNYNIKTTVIKAKKNGSRQKNMQVPAIAGHR
jgi:DNA-binding GntR family transcriptional regulator